MIFFFSLKPSEKLKQQHKVSEQRTTKQVRWKEGEKKEKKKKTSQQNMPYRHLLMAILNKDIVENQCDVWASTSSLYNLSEKLVRPFLPPPPPRSSRIFLQQYAHIAYRNAFLKICRFFLKNFFHPLVDRFSRDFQIIRNKMVREFSLSVRASVTDARWI